MTIVFIVSVLMFLNIVVVGAYYFSTLVFCPRLVKRGHVIPFPELPEWVYVDQGRRIQWGIVFVALGLSLRLGIWLPATANLAMGGGFQRVLSWPLLEAIHVLALIPYVYGCALHLYPRLWWHFNGNWWTVPIALNASLFGGVYYFLT